MKSQGRCGEYVGITTKPGQNEQIGQSSGVLCRTLGGNEPLMLIAFAEFDIFRLRFLLPRRLMARQQTLDLLIEVRILAGQQGILHLGF